MNTIELFNFYYFLYIGILICMTFVISLFLDNQSLRFKKGFILGLIIFNFVIHFLKIFIYPYTLIDHVWTKVTFENISAATILLFPYLYVSKNKTLKDYMIIIGLSAGLIPLIYPADAMSTMFNGTIHIGERPVFMLENIRFYTAHYILFLVAFLMLRYNIHIVSFKRALKIPLIFIGVLVLLFINELLITYFGGVPFENLFDPNKRNPSMIFGIKDGYEEISVLLKVFVPKFMEITHPVYGFTFLVPVIWLMIPLYIYGSMIIILFYVIIDRKNLITWIKKSR